MTTTKMTLADELRDLVTSVQDSKTRDAMLRAATALEASEKREKAKNRTLSALAELARTTTRPSEQPALCRALLDIEGIARAALALGQES